MTVALYARRKGWPLQDVTVRLRHSRVPPWTALNAKRKKDTSFQLDGELTDDQVSVKKYGS